MSGHYAKNPHFQAPDRSEDRERQERAEAAASRWFNDLTQPQLARFNERMAAAAGFKGVPRWDRERQLAQAEWDHSTAEAAAVAQMVFTDMQATGEISEATSYAFDECMMRHTMAQAAE